MARMELQIEQLIRIVANLNKRISRLEYEKSERIFYLKTKPQLKEVEKGSQNFSEIQ